MSVNMVETHTKKADLQCDLTKISHYDYSRSPMALWQKLGDYYDIFCSPPSPAPSPPPPPPPPKKKKSVYDHGDTTAADRETDYHKAHRLCEP